MERFVITKGGMELQAKLVAGTATAAFTKIAVSDHQYARDDLNSLTELLDIRQRVLVSSIERKDATQVEVIAAIENAKLDQGYDIQTLGLYAEDGQGNEVLYAVSVSGERPDYMPPFADAGLSEITYRMNLIVGNSEQVTIHVNPGAVPTVEQVEDIREDVGEIAEELACNLLYIADFSNSSSQGGASCANGHYVCNVPDASIVVWSGEIVLPEGGCAFPASSDTAEVIVKYQLRNADGAEGQVIEYEVEISNGAKLPEGAVVTEYRLERKKGESRIVADIWPMISPGKRMVSEYVPYTGGGRKINRCMAFAIRSLEKLHKFCLEKFLTKDHVANNLVTTNAGYALDARQGKVLKDEINEISEGLSGYCCDFFDVSIPNHDATFVFIRMGQQCIVIARHHVKGVTWDTAASGVYFPAKYRPSVPRGLSGTKYAVMLYESGVIGLWGDSGADFWDTGFAMYPLN